MITNLPKDLQVPCTFSPSTMPNWNKHSKTTIEANFKFIILFLHNDMFIFFFTLECNYVCEGVCPYSATHNFIIEKIGGVWMLWSCVVVSMLPPHFQILSNIIHSIRLNHYCNIYSNIYEFSYFLCSKRDSTYNCFDVRRMPK